MLPNYQMLYTFKHRIFKIDFFWLSSFPKSSKPSPSLKGAVAGLGSAAGQALPCRNLHRRIWFLLLSKVGLNSSFPSDIKASGILLLTSLELRSVRCGCGMVLISCRNLELQSNQFLFFQSERIGI